MFDPLNHHDFASLCLDYFWTHMRFHFPSGPHFCPRQPLKSALFTFLSGVSVEKKSADINLGQHPILSFWGWSKVLWLVFVFNGDVQPIPPCTFLWTSPLQAPRCHCVCDSIWRATCVCNFRKNERKIEQRAFASARALRREKLAPFLFNLVIRSARPIHNSVWISYRSSCADNLHTLMLRKQLLVFLSI